MSTQSLKKRGMEMSNQASLKMKFRKFIRLH